MDVIPGSFLKGAHTVALIVIVGADVATAPGSGGVEMLLKFLQ